MQERKSKNIRITKKRAEILDILSNFDKPVCYEDIRKKISMDKTTFYRNIAKFEEQKIVNRFENEDKRSYFELSENPHAHFMCRRCKGIECIKSIKASLEGYYVESVILKGICKECLRAELS